ncbi:MAG: type II secretion system protein GspF [Hydrogenophilales bacterium CG17_big_fil_post_rev_8_21_14_2_50_63_12]|nr:MAG: type II secretion system protein GspF [Hydrogenophilales bacterium CG17_big_fil_post_rev_8_21_14_2_50_63_12]PIX97620.1 MAG: type II secretion system protein GspF [Hydrogenophilales bacterium CG_4_10_14_3_um_filter_63_21]
MAGFRFEAIDAAGRRETGVLEADTPRQARAQLRERGLIPTQVELLLETVEKQEKRGYRRERGLSTTDLALATRQLATLLAAGLTMEESLSATIEQSESVATQRVLAGVRGEVLGGASLSRAMVRYPAVFSELYCTLVASGEDSGKLGAVLERLADYIEARNTLRRRVSLAFIYPALVTGVSVLVVTGLLTYVVPQVVAVFENSHQTLPLLTRALIGLSALLRGYGLYFLAVLAAALFLFRQALKGEDFRRRWHHTLLRLPLIGRLTRTVNTARLASTLAILSGSGVPLLSALQAAAGVVGNLPMRGAVDEIYKRVREGGSMSRAIAATGLFPPVMAHLVASGEKSGRLPEMLERIASQQTQELDTRVLSLTALLEPLLILAMGGVVLLIVLAILMPIFEMNQMVH